jgi:hypothetical protein
MRHCLPHFVSPPVNSRIACQVCTGTTFRVACNCATYPDCLRPSCLRRRRQSSSVCGFCAVTERRRGPITAPLANSFVLESCVRKSYCKKLVRAAVRVRAVHRMRHLSVPALSSDLISADRALREPRTAAAIRPANLTAPSKNYQPSVDIARVRRIAREPSHAIAQVCHIPSSMTISGHRPHRTSPQRRK